MSIAITVETIVVLILRLMIWTYVWTVLRSGLKVRVIKMSKWKPNRNDHYYFPLIHGEVGGPMPAIWQDSEIDNQRYRMGVVCRTQSETIELARKMLAVAKERVKNDQY